MLIRVPFQVSHIDNALTFCQRHGTIKHNTSLLRRLSENPKGQVKVQLEFSPQ